MELKKCERCGEILDPKFVDELIICRDCGEIYHQDWLCE